MESPHTVESVPQKEGCPRLNRQWLRLAAWAHIFLTPLNCLAFQIFDAWRVSTYSSYAWQFGGADTRSFCHR
jgi:hypothetical protein